MPPISFSITKPTFVPSTFIGFPGGTDREMDGGIRDALQGGFALAGTLVAGVDPPTPGGASLRPHRQPLTQLNPWPAPICKEECFQPNLGAS